MPRDYDSQLLESVAVRRRRLRDALLFGSQRIRRGLEEGLGKVLGGIALATVLCAGCVGWSFIAEQREKSGKSKQPQPTSTVPQPSRGPNQGSLPPASPGPGQVPGQVPGQAPISSPATGPP